MASEYKLNEQALINALREVDADTPRAYPNKDIDEKNKESLWLKITNKRGESSPVTLGDRGEDNHPGFLQIDINIKEGEGTADVLDKADQIADFFTAGKSLIYNNHVTKVLSTSVGAERYVGGYYRISVTVNYYSRTTRS